MSTPTFIALEEISAALEGFTLLGNYHPRTQERTPGYSIDFARGMSVGPRLPHPAAASHVILTRTTVNAFGDPVPSLHGIWGRNFVHWRSWLGDGSESPHIDHDLLYAQEKARNLGSPVLGKWTWLANYDPSREWSLVHILAEHPVDGVAEQPARARILRLERFGVTTTGGTDPISYSIWGKLFTYQADDPRWVRT